MFVIIVILNVVGQMVVEVKEVLKKVNFEVGEEKLEFSDKVEEGWVICIDFEVGKICKEGIKINLIVFFGQQFF